MLRYIILFLQLPALLLSVNQQASTLNSHTWRETVGDVPIWITVLRHGDETMVRPDEGLRWWEWGDTADDSYLFAIGDPEQVKLILSFLPGSDGHPEARSYLNNRGLDPVEFTIDGSAIDVASSDGHAYLQMSPRSGGWLIDGQPNFDLDLVIDGVYRDDIGPSAAKTDGVPDVLIQVGTDSRGEPDWQTAQLLHDPQPKDSYRRYEAQWRLDAHPPLKLAEPFMPTFPYLGFVERLESDWVTESPLPLQFSVSDSQLFIDRFVGVFNGGMVGVGSISRPPDVNFEAPFVWYNFDKATRQSHLVVRGGYSTVNAPLSAELPPQHLNVRYSWKTDSETDWRYSLQLSDFHVFDETIQVGNTEIIAVDPNQFAPWVTNQAWRAITFIEAMQGYPGAEGIYFYSPEAPEDWQWMAGKIDHDSGYLPAPFLTESRELTDASRQALPRGFRGEYAYALPEQPSLYLSAVDGLMHLYGAQGGIWNLGGGKLLRSSDSTQDGFIDTWQLESTSLNVLAEDELPRAFAGDVTETLHDLGTHLIHSAANRVTVLESSEQRTLFTTMPPHDSGTWHSFRNQLAAFPTPIRQPQTLRPLLDNLSGTRSELTNATLQNVRTTADGFRLELRLRLNFAIHGPDLLGVAGLNPGDYIVKNAAGDFTITPLVPAQLSMTVDSQKEDPAKPVRVTIENTGLADATGLTLLVEAQTLAESAELERHAITVPAEDTTQVLINSQLQNVQSVYVQLVNESGQQIASMTRQFLPNEAAVDSDEWLNYRGYFSLPILSGFSIIMALVAQAVLSNRKQTSSL